jgi:2'-5' RNA ligase
VSANIPEHSRLFIAIALPQEIKAELEKTQAVLRKALAHARVSWTRPEQMHLTLRFLGNVETQRLGALIEAVRAACLPFSPLQLRAKGVGFFPNLRFPRVAWASVNDPEQRLLAVQSAITRAVQDFTAEKPEENFTGHVTLARIKRIKRSETRELAKLAEGLQSHRFGEWTAAEVQLFRSELSSEGARHTTLVKLPLAR